LRVIREKCPRALHILDRFHIVAKMNKGLDEVRAAEARHMAAAGHQPLDFQQFWEYESSNWAGKFLTQWCHQAMRSRIEPMKKVALMLRAHRHLILNYFKAQKLLSSGVIEGPNNKAEVTMRKSYGFRTFRVTELALYHTLGKLPEPKLTHRFFWRVFLIFSRDSLQRGMRKPERSR
jgi:transposase